MAANQGLYNGFLAAGLIWSLLIYDPAWSSYVAFFFLGDAFGFGLGDFFGLGDLPGVGEGLAAASGLSSDETCAEAGAAARTFAISSHKQKRATAHVTKRNLRRAEAPELNFPAPVRGAESRSVFRPAIVTDRSDTSRLAE